MFARKGLHGARVGDIAAEAGVAHGLLYHYFKSKDELLETGLAELAAVVDGCASAVNDHVTVEANLRIARGLDYYTGTVLEIFMAGYERLKSVGGGGRYDALASDGRTTYPGVGVSFGLSRTLVPLFAVQDVLERGRVRELWNVRPLIAPERWRMAYRVADEDRADLRALAARLGTG